MALVLVGLAAVVLTADAQAPSWWTNRNLLATNTAPHDFAAVNQGQVKWLATQAAAEFDEKLNDVGGGGTGIVALTSTFTTNNNYHPVNIGQLKFIAQPFYDRLSQLGLTNWYPTGSAQPYPWSNSSNYPNDFSLVNVGQAKYAFSFNIAVDSDGDGIPDIWEVNNGLNPSDPNDAEQMSSQPFAHGLSNLQVYLNPSVLQADGYSSLADGIPDWWKIQDGYGITTPRSTMGANGLTLAEDYQTEPPSQAAITAALDQFSFGQVDLLRTFMNLSAISWDQNTDASTRIAQIRASLETVLVNCLDLTVHRNGFGDTNVVVKWSLATVLKVVGNDTGHWLGGSLSMTQVYELQAVLARLSRVPSDPSTSNTGVQYEEDEYDAEDAPYCFGTWSVSADNPSQWPASGEISTYVIFKEKGAGELYLDDYMTVNWSGNEYSAYTSGNADVTLDWLPNESNEMQAWDQCPDTHYCSDFQIVHVLEVSGPKVEFLDKDDKHVNWAAHF